MKRVRWWLVAAALVAGLIYLRDPAWLGGITTGFGPWDRDPGGPAYRWIGGRASFFVPADARVVEIPVRAEFPADDSRPFGVRASVNDEAAARVLLADGKWQTLQIPCETVPGSRRQWKRIDLHVTRTWDDGSRGVMVGAARVVR